MIITIIQLKLNIKQLVKNKYKINIDHKIIKYKLLFLLSILIKNRDILIYFGSLWDRIVVAVKILIIKIK